MIGNKAIIVTDSKTGERQNAFIVIVDPQLDIVFVCFN